MRKDYEYIQSAVSLDVTSTSLGKQVTEAWVANDMPDAESLMINLLLVAEDEYIIVPNPCNIDQVVSALKEREPETFGNVAASDLCAVVAYAFSVGWLAFRIVIWDDGNPDQNSVLHPIRVDEKGKPLALKPVIEAKDGVTTPGIH